MNPAAAAIIAQVAQVTGHRAETILGHSKDSPISKARYMAMLLVYQLTPLRHDEIAAAFQRDRSLLDHAKKRVVQLLARDPAFARNYRQLIAGRPVLRELEGRNTLRRKPHGCAKLEGRADTHGSIPQLNAKACDQRLKQAREEAAHWTMKKASAANSEARAAAGVRLTLWSQQVEACERRLRELARTEALPA
jgi:hypothetical protein